MVEGFCKGNALRQRQTSVYNVILEGPEVEPGPGANCQKDAKATAYYVLGKKPLLMLVSLGQRTDCSSAICRCE